MHARTNKRTCVTVSYACAAAVAFGATNTRGFGAGDVLLSNFTARAVAIGVDCLVVVVVVDAATTVAAGTATTTVAGGGNRYITTKSWAQL